MFVLRRAVACYAIVLVLLQPAAFGWGEDGHQLINRVAAEKVPASMPSFLREAADRIAYLGPEPDRWREKSELQLKNSQEPDHFIDLERIDDMPSLPPTRYEFIRALYDKRARMAQNADDYLPEKVGFQPYITMEVYGRLKVAFREYRRLKEAKESTAGVEQNIVYYAGWLGHYVGDGANPLHTTIQYNGWVGDNPKGYTTAHTIHWEMEGAFVARNIKQLKIADLIRDPIRLQDPFADYVRYLRQSRELVENVYQLEKAGGFKDAGSPEALEFVRHRLAAGTQMVLNLWYTAWEESAVPVPAKN